MKISCFTDLRFTATPTPTGVGKHVVQMIQGLRAKPDVQLTLAVTRDQLTPDGKVPDENRLAGIDVTPIPGTSNSVEALWTLLNWPSIDRHIGDADWVYCPKNDMVAANKPRWAATFHGVHEFDPQLKMHRSLRHKLGALRWKMQDKRIVRRSNLILTVSEFLKQQLVEFFHADPSRIVVVGNGVEPIYYETADAPPGISGQPQDRPYILCVGGLNHLDGADYLLPVAELLQKTDPALRILIAGNQHDAPYTDRAKGLKNIELLGYVPAPKLAQLMRDAAVFLFLSRYETFGIAGAEAMAAGAPVIASNLTAVPEVIGDGGFVVDPAETEKIVQLILDLARTPSLRSQYRDLGRARAARYTWGACVDRLYAALK